MPTPEWQNLVVMFFDQAARRGEHPFLWYKRQGRYEPLTWREVAARVTSLARGLISLGVAKGERIVLVAENRPAWLIADVGIMAAGAITVPAYTTNTEADHLHVLRNTEACGVIVSTRRIAAPLLRAAAQCPSIRFIITIEAPQPEPELSVPLYTWQDVIARGNSHHTNIVAEAQAIKPADPACIIHTSGTGGPPKGVMLHHGAILQNCRAAGEVLSEISGGENVFLSLLPLSHAYEHTVGQFLPIALGAQIYYAEGVEKVALNIREAQPTLISAVPRFYELMQQRITAEARKAGGWREKLFRATLAIGRKRYHARNGLSLGERLVDALLDTLVRRSIRQRFGGRLKAMVSGGAPLNPEVGLFFVALGLPVYQGFGQTEAAPLISVNRAGSLKVDTVGPPLKDVEVRIADDGEILVRGPMVMLGYWRNEDATKAAIHDGWLHTGDIGRLDEDGHLVILDRKKDIIINSGGDNISPARVEGLLTQQPEIAQAFAAGDRRSHLVALLVPEEGWLKAWARAAGKPFNASTLARDPDFLAAMRAAVERANAGLSVIEKVRRFAVTAEAFSTENGQMTPTLKLRRHVIRSSYRDLLESLHD
ncbi:MAG: long-chain fatty acid--CoA ligase [Defluviicoccus sp.]